MIAAYHPHSFFTRYSTKSQRNSICLDVLAYPTCLVKPAILRLFQGVAPEDGTGARDDPGRQDFRIKAQFSDSGTSGTPCGALVAPRKVVVPPFGLIKAWSHPPWSVRALLAFRLKSAWFPGPFGAALTWPAFWHKIPINNKRGSSP